MNDGGGMEAQNRRGGSGPSDGIREAGDRADIDIAHVPERGGNSIGQNSQGGSAQSLKIGPDRGFGARSGDGIKVDGERAVGERARGDPRGLGFVQRRDQL